MSRPGSTSAIRKRVMLIFFSEVANEDSLWECSCGTRRKKSGSGYANLISHVESKHPDELKQLKETEQSLGSHASTTMTAPVNIAEKSYYFFVSKVVSAFGWIDFITKAFLPFSVVENETYRKHLRYPHIGRKSLIKYMESLTQRVEKNISSFICISILWMDRRADSLRHPMFSFLF